VGAVDLDHMNGLPKENPKQPERMLASCTLGRPRRKCLWSSRPHPY